MHLVLTAFIRVLRYKIYAGYAVCLFFRREMCRVTLHQVDLSFRHDAGDKGERELSREPEGKTSGMPSVGLGQLTRNSE